MSLNEKDNFDTINGKIINIYSINTIKKKPTNIKENFVYKKNVSLSNSFNNLLIFSDEFNKINELSNILDDLFLINNLSNDNQINYEDSQIIFNHIYEQEFERGNIEYKRTLETYSQNNKINKLIRQIHWRIYEGIVCINSDCCYYIIGIEDTGCPSFLTKNELLNSLNFISRCVVGTEITYSYLFVKNTILNYEYVIIKFLPNEKNFIDYF